MNTSHKKKYLHALCAVCLALSVASCGGDGSSSESSEQVNNTDNNNKNNNNNDASTAIPSQSSASLDSPKTTVKQPTDTTSKQTSNPTNSTAPNTGSTVKQSTNPASTNPVSTQPSTQPAPTNPAPTEPSTQPAPNQPPSTPSTTEKARPNIDLSFVPSSTGKTYTLDLARWNINNKGDKTNADANTTAMQNAINWASSNGYDTINVPAGNYLIGQYGNAVFQAGIKLPSNITFNLDKNAVIQMHTNDKWNYCLIDVREQKNVVIRGGTLKGDRDSHIYTPRISDGKTAHDEGHLLCIQHESENVLVENMTLTHATGDGIFDANRDKSPKI